jgi:hypothetical protein
MSNSVKVTLYAVLVLLASVSGYFALSNFGRIMSRAGERNSDLEQVDPERKPAETVAETTDTTATNASMTNTLSSLLSTNASSNAISAGTNQMTAVGPAEPTNAAPAKSASTRKSLAAKAAAKSEQAKSSGRVGLWLGLLVISVVSLGLLIAHDVSQYFGNKALNVLYNDEGEGLKDPAYDEAEEAWANGDHLGAIKMMREYLTKNPRQQHVAIRIAEIYEKDLNNNLAAALEYEEVLQHKLQPDRWGWAAIHLCNLYFRLNQEQKGFDLLRRIVNEHPSTPAAEKARKRLEQVDGSAAAEQIATEAQVSATARVASAEPPPSAPASNLPPGFRPKR